MLILLDYNYPDYEIMSQLSNLPCVTEVNKVGGPYDIVAKLSDNSTDTIKESIGKHMTTIKGIQSTLTLISE
jgi:DNA-binding Lrp family transcriptional regulator